MKDVKDINYSHYSDHFTIYTNITSLCCIPKLIFISIISQCKKYFSKKRGGNGRIILGKRMDEMEMPFHISFCAIANRNVGEVEGRLEDKYIKQY